MTGGFGTVSSAVADLPLPSSSLCAFCLVYCYLEPSSPNVRWLSMPEKPLPMVSPPRLCRVLPSAASPLTPTKLVAAPPWLEDGFLRPSEVFLLSIFIGKILIC